MDKIRVAKVDNIILEQAHSSNTTSISSTEGRTCQHGTLHLTPHHLIFSPTSTSSSAPASEKWISYPTITLLTRLPQSIQGLYPLQIRTKLFESYILLFEKDYQGGAEDVWQSVKDCAVKTSVEQLYAFYYTPPRSSNISTSTSTSANGWNVYNPREEFSRQGMGTRTKAWRFTDINKDYSFCPTYPNKMVVPSRISDSVLAYAGKYRSKGRIPALTYLHWANQASITRSSQPMVGLKNARSAQDERLVECIFSAHLFSDTAYTQADAPVYGATSTNLIIDARPTTNAMANVAMGAGTENMDNYRMGKKAYLGIDNIHVMRNSLKVVAEAIAETEQSPTATLDRGLLRKSNWLRHISTLLDGALVIVKNIHLNASHVLIHCSDGWDRTSQLSATAQICLDPYYRTIDGFKILIEKDWLSFGHKFLDRSGHFSSEKLFTVMDAPEDDSEDEFGGAQKAAQAFFASVQSKFSSTSNHQKEVSPVFHQFLDSIWQIYRQFPERFEFNEDLLLDLYEHLYSCQSGTFLFNSELQRRGTQSGKALVERTGSLWDQLDLHDKRYLNPDYRPELDDRNSREPDADQGVLLPDPKEARFWYRLFKRGDEEMNGSAITLQQQAQGAEVLGVVGAGQTDPLSIPGVVAETVAPSGSTELTTASSRDSRIFEESAKPRSSTPQNRSRDGDSSQGGWGRWSQLSSGAFNALQGAARDIKNKGQEAYNQMVVEEPQTQATPKSPIRRNTPTSDSVPYLPRVAARRIPSEANPWAVPTESTPDPSAATQVTSISVPTSSVHVNEVRSDFSHLSLREPASVPTSNNSIVPPKPARQVSMSAEEKAALGGDQKAWDPLGAL